MPTINAYMDTAGGRVLVETNWSDVPDTMSVQVVRVHADGTEWPLRTYVWPDAAVGEYQHLSGGYAAFWDTEAPLDAPFTYLARGVDAAGTPMFTPNAPSVYDTFTRTVAAGSWGSATTGQAWSNDVGAGAQSSVNGTQGLHIHTDLGNPLITKLAGTPVDSDVTVEVACSLLTATGEMSIFNRYTDINNWYRIVVVANSGSASLQSAVAGVGTTLGTATGVFTPTSAPLKLRLRIQGIGIKAKVWVAAGAEPDAWLFQAAHSGLTTGTVALGDYADTAAKTFTFDALNIFDLSNPPVLWTVTTGSFTLASGGDFWLRDPVRPCNDQRISLCFDPAATPPGCDDSPGIFFADMAQETYSANSALLLPTNARHPVPVARERRDADSTLTLVTRTFQSRDDVLALNQPGSPLQFVAPPAYGIPDRYVSVGAESVSKGVPDMTFEPRLIQLPFSTVDRPAGPSQGVCGARFDDLCDTYATWTLAAASGLAYSTLITGAPGALGWRTWAVVLSSFGTWAGVLAAEPTWAEVLVP